MLAHHATLNLAVDSDAQHTLVNSAAVKIGGARGCGVVSVKGGKVSAKRRLDCLGALGVLANQQPCRASATFIRSCQHETSKARRKTLTRTLGLNFLAPFPKYRFCLPRKAQPPSCALPPFFVFLFTHPSIDDYHSVLSILRF